MARTVPWQAFAKIRLLTLDVDGVLTDGGLYYGDDGKVSRKFNVTDGVGIKRVMDAGVEVAFVSAGRTESTRFRAEALGVRHAFIGVTEKLATVETLARGLGISLAAVAHVGDDLNDLALMRAVGLAITVPDAAREVAAVARLATRRRGGEGAVREVCDRIVAARAKVGAGSARR